METVRSATPWHLWVVGLLALMFTAFGGYDYTMSQLGDRDYIAAAMGPMGVDPDVALAHMEAFPLWMDFVWAIGVWGGVAGALLLLFRSRFAYPVLLMALVAFIVSNAYGIANPIPGMDPSAVFMPVAVIFVVMVGLVLYARAMRRRGVLR